MWFPICLYLSVSYFLRVTASISLKCSFVKNRTISLREVICKCYEAGKPPWSEKSEKPATKPKRVLAEFKFEDGKHHAHISWIHESRFLGDVKDGFFLELSSDHGLNYLYNCDVEMNNINVTNDEEVKFYFNECCSSLENGAGWTPGMELEVHAHARPMYTKDSEPHYAKSVATVPSSSANDTGKSLNKKRKKKKRKSKLCRKRKKRCRNRRKHGLSDQVEPESSNDKPLLLLIITTVCCFSIMLILVLAFLTAKSKRRKKVKSSEIDRNLLVIAENGDGSHPFANCLVETIKSAGLPGAKVTTNVRNSTEIACEGIVPWIKRNMEVADVVIFVVTKKEQLLSYPVNSTKTENQCSSVSMALKIAESLSLKNGCHVSKKKYIVLNVYSIANLNSLQFCAYCTLERDFPKLMKHALGLHHRNVDIFQGDCSTLVKWSRFEKNISSESTIAPTNSRDDCNNLNRSLSCSKKEAEDSSLPEPNIAYDLLSSVESNELR